MDAWRGVPFATPPVGTLRFSPPSPPVPWSPARHDASRFGPDCHQPLGPENPGATVEHMSEDCLYVNVLTPAGHSRRARPGWVAGGAAPLPVMVWIHGGAFRQGSGAREEYDGRRLAERDLVVVTFNYRLGALGFLVSLEDGLTGNYGIMDQRAALEWVNKNIRAFGGDPENVTLFGESSGAISIGLHLQMDGAGTLILLLLLLLLLLFLFLLLLMMILLYYVPVYVTYTIRTKNSNNNKRNNVTCVVCR